MDAVARTPQGRAMLHSLYRRLRAHGEDPQMIRRSLETRSLQASVETGRQLLRLHTQSLAAYERYTTLRFWQLPAKLVTNVTRRKLYWQIFLIRLRLRSVAAISDALMMVLVAALCFLAYTMYQVCRVGLNQADQKYRSLSIPILQSLDALEKMQERKTTAQKEIDSDIRKSRERDAESYK